jgi:hypothetical protein
MAAAIPTIAAGVFRGAGRLVRGVPAVRVDGRTNLGNRGAGVVATGGAVVAVSCAGVRGGTGDEQEAGG